MSNNSCFIQCHFKIIPFTHNSNIITCFINRSKNKHFWSASRHLMTLSRFRVGLNLDGLFLVLSFQTFFQPLFKMADFQGIKDSSDIFLSYNNFPLIRLSKSSTMLSVFSIYVLWFPIIRTFASNLTKVFIFDYP